MTFSAINRRAAIRVGGAGMLGMNMPKLLRAADQSGSIKPRAKSVIFLFQWGGPSQLDTFDMKPNAPEKVRSPYRPISTSAPGIQICELMPEMAKRMHHCSLIRTMTHTMNNHASAGYYALSGHKPPTDDQRLRDSLDLYPAYGSVVDHLAPNTNGMPTFVAYPHVIRDGSVVPAQHASFLGKRHDPLRFLEDPNDQSFKLPELSLPQGLSIDRLHRRREMQKLIDQQTKILEYSDRANGFDDYYQRAMSMLTSDRVRKAFDLSSEPEQVRDRYGRTTYGQSCLLARRLVEAGVKFTTVYFSASIGGRRVNEGGWDTHGFDNTRMYEIVNNYQLPITDQTLPTLLDDLEERGLLDETLVVWMGEFGRTPDINKNISRDHWPRCYTTLLAGGGVKGGYVYGTSDEHARMPAENPVKPEDLAATIFHLLGIDPLTEIYDRDHRPLVIGGDTIYDLFA
ncbi:DUF1501 domain-containing protein [Rhodopirellula sp. MGV]|uniref:DUF1501 domain-containing protein n=1 Tax=Rhodopirellula sp. MGV TaxID=2023130 RepID=UPI000B9628B4|nr:DUF1501 domain-containing protein [Rhodopirellula sp. MGV]OYP36588.1 hypothetical protein CGZ80_08135 [Rhodopirellula sp. MGV]PNY34565.1 DUF1501 domain-containing protein [Rhodopirellula baltica]